MCSDNEASPPSRQSLPASPSSLILNERSVKGKGQAIDGDGDIEMAEAHHNFVCKTKSMSSWLFFVLFSDFFFG